MFEELSDICAASSKPVVLMIDEDVSAKDEHPSRRDAWTRNGVNCAVRMILSEKKLSMTMAYWLLPIVFLKPGCTICISQLQICRTADFIPLHSWIKMESSIITKPSRPESGNDGFVFYEITDSQPSCITSAKVAFFSNSSVIFPIFDTSPIRMTPQSLPFKKVSFSYCFLLLSCTSTVL